MSDQNTELLARDGLPPLREVFVAAGRPQALNHPDTNKALAAKALGGPSITLEDGADARLKLF